MDKEWTSYIWTEEVETHHIAEEVTWVIVAEGISEQCVQPPALEIVQRNLLIATFIKLHFNNHLWNQSKVPLIDH